MDWESRIGRRITLRDLHILSHAVRCGSMAKAATQMSTTQSVVSDAIANLESALGVRLLDRSTRGVEATVYAKALLKRSHVVFDELREAVRDIETSAESTTGEVRLACPEFLAGGIVTDVVDRLSRTYPEILCEVVEADVDSLEFRQLHERRVDLMVARVPDTLSDDALGIEILFDDPHVVVTGQDSRWARRADVTLADLADEPWILPASLLVQDIVTESFEAAGLRPPKGRVVSAFLLMRNHLLETGRFVTVLPTSVLGLDARQTALCPLPIRLKTKARPVAIVTLKNRSVSPAVRLFIEQLRLTAGQYAAQTPNRSDG